jgi:hypothetical protein
MAVLAVTLAIGAIGVPAAFGAARRQASPRAGATIVRVSDRSGFDWAAAGVGAVGGFALSIVCVGLVLLIRPST